jgi:hypothetical protein
MQLKQGDLATVNLGERSTSSNTYRVERKLDGECLLSHPLSPDCVILKPDHELNTVLAQLKSPTERCLEFSSKWRKYLDFDDACEVEALCLYFVVRRSLSARQKKNLSNLCGTIAAIYFQNEITQATKLVNENRALLDSFNQTWYNNFEKYFQGKKPIETRGARAAIFNISGFVLAQLEGL